MKRIKRILNEQLRMEMIAYKMLVQQDISTLNFNEDIDKKVNSFIFTVLILGGIFSWCSSSDTSNIYILLSKYMDKRSIPILVNVILMVVFIIPTISKVCSYKNKSKKILIRSLTFYVIQNEIFEKFIASIININNKIKNAQELYDLLEERNMRITFSSFEFENYLKVYLDKYKFEFPYSFIDNLVNLMLINQRINNNHLTFNSSQEYTLVFDKFYILNFI